MTTKEHDDLASLTGPGYCDYDEYEADRAHPVSHPVREQTVYEQAMHITCSHATKKK